MGEAKRRRQTGQSWKGALPDAMFIRTAKLEIANITLCGNLHVLQPPPDVASLMQLVSKLADQLMDPDNVPRPDDPAVMQMWAAPEQRWNYGLAETLEIKRLLRQSTIVRVAMSDHGEQCTFSYDLIEDAGQNQNLADGLLTLRPGG